jgi:hypothetical protein
VPDLGFRRHARPPPAGPVKRLHAPLPKAGGPGATGEQGGPATAPANRLPLARPRARPPGPGHAAEVVGRPLNGPGAGVRGGGRRARARARAARPRARGLRGSRAVAGVPGHLPRPRRALLEGMDPPRALQPRPRALQHSRGPGARGARPPRLQFRRNRLREAAPGGVPPGPAHLGRRGRGGTACHPHRSGGGPSTGTLLQPRRSRKSAEAVTTDSRPVSPCRSQEKPWRKT